MVVLGESFGSDTTMLRMSGICRRSVGNGHQLISPSANQLIGSTPTAMLKMASPWYTIGARLMLMT